MVFEEFWKDDAAAHKDNCFSESAQQIAMGLRMSHECVYAELGEDGDPWGREPPERQWELNCRYNDKSETIVGKRLLPEIPPEETVQIPYVRRIGEVFEGVYEWPSNTGEWLHSRIESPSDLEAVLDRVDRLDLESFMLPENWESEKKKLFERTRRKPELLRHVRGPVTLASSLFGAENLIYLFYDAPELFKRFSDTILSVLLIITRIMDREAGYTEENRPPGFSFADDDCSLLSPEMYEVFGLPVLKGVFDVYSPNAADTRYQHSDSGMGHLLPLLGQMNLTGCNFGPTVLVDEIRRSMRRTRIDGCLSPFTFMNNDEPGIRKEVIRDCEMIKDSGTRGLNITTAGSVNNGSSLASMKLIMETIQEHGRY